MKTTSQFEKNRAVLHRTALRVAYLRRLSSPQLRVRQRIALGVCSFGWPFLFFPFLTSSARPGNAFRSARAPRNGASRSIFGNVERSGQPHGYSIASPHGCHALSEVPELRRFLSFFSRFSLGSPLRQFLSAPAYASSALLVPPPTTFGPSNNADASLRLHAPSLSVMPQRKRGRKKGKTKCLI